MVRIERLDGSGNWRPLWALTYRRRKNGEKALARLQQHYGDKATLRLASAKAVRRG